jgi:flagellar motor component MotA
MESTERRGARLDGRTAAALACGAVGLFLFNVVFGPVAIALGAVAARRNPEGRPVALVAVALGVADLVVLVTLVAARVHGGTFSWHLGY